MKVLHISSFDSGGAGQCALRIHKALLNIGVDSKMLVANKTSDMPSVFVAEQSNLNRYVPPSNKALRKIEYSLRKRGLLLTELEKLQRSASVLNGKATYTYPISSYRLDQHPLVAEADVIHLHWVANFIDYPTFFPNIDKPIVWTFHDENIGFGGFHYKRDREKYGNLCPNTENALSKIKQKSLANLRSSLSAIAISNMMQAFLNETPTINSHPVYLINNSVDTSIFKPIVDKRTARSIFDIPNDHLVFAFCCVSLKDERKGLKELIKAMERLEKKEKITLLCAGNDDFKTDTELNIVKTGPLRNERLMSLFYCCADFFAMPSFQEAFAQTPLEAMACGVPVIAFPCSGTEELITDINGIRCDAFTVDSLYNGIMCAMRKKYDSNVIRQDMINRFSPQIIAQKYLDIYTSS